MRILFLSNMYPNFLGGTFIHNQVKYLMDFGCEVKVIVPVPYWPKTLNGNERWRAYAEFPEYDSIDMVSVYYPRYIRLPGKWFHGLSCYAQYFGSIKLAHSIIKEFKPSILHTHAATAPGYVGLLLKRKYNLPLVCSLRGSDINVYPHYGKYSMWLTRKLISEADQLLSVSNALKDVANTLARPKKEIQVVYNGCDLNAFAYSKKDRLQVRSKLRISEDAKTLIFVGSIARDKGIYELIKVFIGLSSQNGNLHLVVAGEGPEESILRNLVQSNGLGDKVHLVGRLSHMEIPKYLNAADMFVLPSYNEGLPNVVLEAMACSLPVIATRVGGIPEAIEEGKSGILVNAKDTDSLRESIKYLIEHEEVAKEMGIYGQQTVRERFSWQHNVDKLIEIYKEMLNGL